MSNLRDHATDVEDFVHIAVRTLYSSTAFMIRIAYQVSDEHNDISHYCSVGLPLMIAYRRSRLLSDSILTCSQTGIARLDGP